MNGLQEHSIILLRELSADIFLVCILCIDKNLFIGCKDILYYNKLFGIYCIFCFILGPLQSREGIQNLESLL